MALVVNSNIQSLNSQRQLSRSTEDLGTSFERLSSGKRINSARDDAAGLQIASRLSSQVNGLNQASRNSNDAISLAQTAEGALDEYTNTVQRLRTLAVQSSNGSNSSADRIALKEEYTALTTELDRISEQTSFGGVNLLDGSYDETFQVGANAGQTIDITISQNFSSASLGASGALTAAVVVGGSALASGTSVVSGTTINGLVVASVTVTVADDVLGGVVAAQGTVVGVSTFESAQLAIQELDDALATVNSTRAELGASQNRFSSVIRSNDNTAQNVSASRSRIEDTDYAAESAALARNNVLQQAASSLLAQANQQPQIALSLL